MSTSVWLPRTATRRSAATPSTRRQHARAWTCSEACGIESDDLEVRTSTTLLDVLCLTLCARCAAADMAPPVAVSTAVRLVAQHCGHLGIDLDQMAAAIAERDGGR
jgi:hypothetical protein